jgi:hypothetical protein
MLWAMADTAVASATCLFATRVVWKSEAPSEFGGQFPVRHVAVSFLSL